jgi:hypothetical protein
MLPTTAAEAAEGRKVSRPRSHLFESAYKYFIEAVSDGCRRRGRGRGEGEGEGEGGASEKSVAQGFTV